VATATVTGLTVIDDADSATNWVSVGSGPGGGLTNDIFIQGTGAFGRRANSSPGRGVGVDISPTIDLSTSSGNKVFAWIAVPLGPDQMNNITAATPGLMLRFSSTAGGGSNYEEFAIGGGDVTDNKWRIYVMAPEALTPINTNGTVTWTSIANISIILAWTTTPGGNIPHFAMDSLSYGDALEVTGGTTGDRLTWDDVRVATEETGTPDQLWGAIQTEPSGNLLLNGNFQFGDAAGALDCYFEDQDKVITWQEQFYHDGTNFASAVPDNYQGITIVNDTGVCEWQDGVKVGTDNGSNGSIFQSPALSVSGTGSSLNQLHFTATDADVDNVQLYGTQFRRFSNDFSLSSDATNGPNFELMGATITESDQAVIGRAVTRNTAFTSVFDYAGSGNIAALAWNANIDISDCTFTNNTDATAVTAHDIEHTAAGTEAYDNLTTSGAEQEILFSAASGDLTVNLSNGSNFQTGTNPANHTVTGTGNITVNNAVTVRVQGVTEGTQVNVIAAESKGTITAGDSILNALADANGIAENTGFNYETAFEPDGLDVAVRARNQGFANAAIADDGGVLTDETTAANNTTANSVNLLPASPVANDQYYLGHSEQFNQIKIDITDVNGTGSTITWQYWNGAWVSLSDVVDNTNNFENSGENTVSWTMPGDWATTTVNSQGPFYYVRARLTTLGSANQTRAERVSLDVTRYVAFAQTQTITSSGLTARAVWQQDTISTFF
jgi:hypothetical protein